MLMAECLLNSQSSFVLPEPGGGGGGVRSFFFIFFLLDKPVQHPQGGRCSFVIITILSKIRRRSFHLEIFLLVFRSTKFAASGPSHRSGCHSFADHDHCHRQAQVKRGTCLCESKGYAAEYAFIAAEYAFIAALMLGLPGDIVLT